MADKDYSKLEEDTGPLVHAAGFLYIYFAIQNVTGGQIFPAQNMKIGEPFSVPSPKIM
ncbi:dol-p-man:man(5)glcnac(2)-pp-dol alpha-1 3-mannosyltransferase [Phtheirospermum japonicum]|uniref:Dol-p-man:man(5)glcnac(2)-pp-dol alpha-1 3-mannosyltransferase n=1 Tax=Phtheirospermum japonicum TaxID=374723 RepID=A0A830D3Z7_9LAMI|nr:dol-p-man:man(5)glcnac(2)-pp-dol alpha-1 3-mannosyltransferase [Phtheirospermum japonicum]